MWDKIPAIRILMPLLSGIIVALEFPQFNIPADFLFWIFLPACVCLALVKKKRTGFKFPLLPGILLQITLFTGGLYILKLSNPTTHSNYFGNKLTETSLVTARITLPPEEREKTIKLTVAIEEISDEGIAGKCFGKSLIYIKKDSLAKDEFHYGDILLLENNFLKPTPPKNPNEFEYAKYLESQGIYYTAFFKKDEYIQTGERRVNTAWQIIFNCRVHFEQLLQQYIHDKDAYGVSSALLLGVRSTISDEIVQAYANTGTMHILSVSGLHVGIFYLILDFILNLLPYFKSDSMNRKYLKAIIITCIIWFYACMTGLCPSVARSAVMFTFLIFGKLNRKHVNSYNVLAASAIPLLIANPYMVTQVGFQLSYLAILGIVTFQPVIHKLYRPRTKLMTYIWSLVNVSIAAQIGTIPVTIYYFHQFPNYFLLSNIVAIPLSFLVLVAGVAFFCLSFIHSINDITGSILEFLLKALNYVVVKANTIPGALLDNLYLTQYQALIFYSFFIFLAIFIYSKNKRFFTYALLSMCILCTTIGVRKYSQLQQNSISLYSLPGSFLIAETHGANAKLYSPQAITDTSADFRYHILGDLLAKGIHNYEFLQIADTTISENAGNYFLIDTVLFCYLGKDNSIPDAVLPSVNELIIAGNYRIKPQQATVAFPNANFILSPANSNRTLSVWKTYCNDEGIAYRDIKNEGYTVLDYQ